MINYAKTTFIVAHALYISYLVYKHVQETDMIEKNTNDFPVKSQITPHVKTAVTQFLNSDSTLARYRRLYYSISLVYLMDFFACICYFLGMADQDLTGKTAININAIYFMQIGLSFTGIHCSRIGLLFHSIRSLKLDSLKFKDEVLKTTKKIRALRDYAKQPTLVNNTMNSNETDTIKVENRTAVFI
ncbi:hypothetical protein HDV06_005120 [Boothiomyces sp. JEL0866]|nr:hypothetical protein HDV06_005120 [Boothiomyces sp. JEL0866]